MIYLNIDILIHLRVEKTFIAIFNGNIQKKKTQPAKK